MTIFLCLALIAPTQAASANDDYLRAAAIVANGSAELKPIVEGNVLEWSRKATEKYGSALDWVKAGNQKPFVLLERRSLNGEFPELAGFRSLGFLFEAKVFEHIADGKPNQAANALIDALTFGRRVQSIGTIGHIVGSQIIERNLRMFDLNRRAFVEEGLEKLTKLELIQSIPSDKMAFDVEFLAFGKYNEIERLSPTERTEVLARIEALKRGTEAQLAREEAYWKWGSEDPAPEALAGLEVALEVTWARALVIRTKLRLLTATSKILLHDVRNYKLPDVITEVHDPATGKPFFFGKRDDAFVMYSEGVEKTGRIELGTLWNRER
ncbi:MAG: hypothetical protein ABIV13_03800 [Fimbriimonadales bacterium]